MAMSSITVSGITPSLSILGAFQEFIYNQNSSAFRLYNNFEPTISISSETNFEYRNNALSGFRWIHSTNNTDSIGQLTLQSFLSASSTGTDIISFNNDGSISFISPIVFPSIFNVAGGTQTFLYDVPVSQFILKNDAVNSDVAYVLNSEDTLRAQFGYNHVNDETYIESLSSLSFYVNSPSTPQFKINSTTGEIEINTEVIASANVPSYSFRLNNNYVTGTTKYVISQNDIEQLTLTYEKDINISLIESLSPLDIVINGETTCIFNESDVDFNNNPIINATWSGATIAVNKGGTGQTTLTSNALLVGNGTSALNQISPGSTGTVLIGNTGGSPTFSSTPTVSSISITNSPVNSTDGVNKSYVDALYAGIEFKQACYGATTTNLLANYNNGTGGINATLTSTSFGTFTIDGLTPNTSKRILVKNQSDSIQNGVYTVFNVGGPAAFWVLKRATDFDEPDEINPGALVPVEFGNTNAISSWIETGIVTTIGTDNINFTAFTYSPESFLEVNLNLSDVANPSTARSNLGLTNVATQTVTNNAVLIGAASNAINSISLTNGQILIGSTGGTPVGAIPSNGNNISWSIGSGSLTANISGLIPLTNGGTNANLTASNGGIVYSTASSLAILSGTATAGQILRSGSSTAPTWSTATYPSTTTVNQLLFSSATNTISGLTTANNGVLITDSGGVPSISSTLPSAVQENISTTSSTLKVGSTGQGTIFARRATGQCYFNNNSTSSGTVAANSWTKILGTTTSANLNYFDTNGGTNNLLRYTGTDNIYALITANVYNTTIPGGSLNWAIVIYKNGSLFTPSIMASQGNERVTTSTTTIVPMSTNDYIEVWVYNDYSSPFAYTAKYLTLTVTTT